MSVYSNYAEYIFNSLADKWSQVSALATDSLSSKIESLY